MSYRKRLLRPLASLTAVAAAAGGAPAAAHAAAPVRHVFVVVLENESYNSSFGPSSPATYLARGLPAQGALLPNYYATGHQSNDNYIAMISGQGPNPATQADCGLFVDVMPGLIGPDGQASGAGCVYPPAVATVANQLETAGSNWRGYMEDIGNSTTAAKTCRHPAPGTPDDTQQAHAGDQYAIRHDPFVYFHSIIDNPAGCAANVVGLDRLYADLGSASTTPSYSFIVPNLCHDGHDAPCVDGAPGGLVSADAFLQGLVPQILASPAYRADGLLVVTFDEGASSDASACCGERSANTPNAGGTTQGPGGGRVGAVALSPFIAPGTVDPTPYNHYSLLRAVEDIFGLAHLGYAAQDTARPLAGALLTAPAAGAVAVKRARGCAGTRLPRAAAHRHRHRLARGSVIGDAAVRRRGARRRLEFVALHAARLAAELVGDGRHRALRTRRIRACHNYAIALPERPGHGTVRLVAAVGHASERRSVRF